MLKKSFLFLLLIIFTANLSAQESEDKKKSKWKDKWEHRWDMWDDESRPFMEFNYGLGEPKHKKLHDDFNKVGLLEFKIGYSTVNIYESDYVLELDEKYIFGSNISNDLKSGDKNLTGFNSDSWRFGFGNRTGYGYKLGEVSILPYYQYDFTWTKLDVKNLPDVTILLFPPAAVVEDVNTLERFNGAFRFGNSSSGGIKIEVAGFLGLNADYETAVVYPRHLFWKQAGSFLAEQLVIQAVDYFVDEIMDRSPAAAPIVNFILKNGVSYAFYALKRDDMNWPFKTETPLTYETARFGLSFAF